MKFGTHNFLNKFAAKWCKHFPPHLNNVSTLLCETWNGHCARSTIALLDRETLEFIPPQLWSSNSPDANPVDNSVWKILQEGIQNMHHWSGTIDDATDRWLPQWGRDSACSTPFSVAVSVRPDQWCIFFTSSKAHWWFPIRSTGSNVVSRTVLEIYDAKILWHRSKTVQCHPRSKVMVPIESP